ncbi:argininosuccinate synthase [Saprolegnia parasitica CBS 223.65]|uniref:argininosuccinate synthase n=1 Tax=Saprolegnia parasitica (strain CBS 223.65) TaxID=695850 RepID=A0A067CQW0_SAPPC|nr:argininosuccinate synthase [Saprolegnia parasitica CBS 223.65]KDO32903.1 argininosuccinate synthase [Saprolegnia parasitica CBS 223.65]|eukprot:XP_012196667.1 argininosuccinate synthase [Saprolegnia parasitica CBS 223.65]
MSVKANPGDKVVLAYSGGLDTSIILKWLVNKGFQVVCYCANVGQFGENFEKVQAKAMALGAAKVYIEDLRKEFVVDYLWPAVQANAIYESRYLLGTSLARPVIAKKMVEIAEKEGCKYVAHGATGKGNDQVAPDAAEKIRITFENGVPVQVANLTTPSSPVLTDPLELFLELNRLGGKHGVGRIDIVENRFVGIKSRGVYETPGGTILRDAHLDLEGLCMDREVMKLRDALSVKFAEFCYNGFWFAPEMDFVRHAIAFSQKAIAGHVDVELYKGNVTITGRYSDVALYSADLASMDMEGGGANIEYNPSDAQGFIRINATRLKAYNCIQKKSA